MMPKKKGTLQLQKVKSTRDLYLLFLSPQGVCIILCMLFCLLVSLLFFARGATMESPNLEHSLTSKTQPTSTVHVDPTPTSQSQVSSTVSQAIPSPLLIQKALPAPIYPFPRDVRQQVGVLELHQRFFFAGNPTLPEIALTFDDGPNPPYTSQVLAVLKQYNVKASFFDVGRHVAEYPDLVRQELAQGNTVAIHSWNHVYLTGYSAAAIDKQLGDTSAALKKATGVQPNFFRPPYGVYNATVLAEANKLGLTTFMWNDVASDWLLPGTNVISSRVINAARYGSIVLLHDGDGDHYNAIASREQTVRALPTIITTLQARGYHFVTLDQLVADMHK
jgi:peptidoglycan/xylan/chitin deacetylase (PgdA/CDA1 family)